MKKDCVFGPDKATNAEFKARFVTAQSGLKAQGYNSQTYSVLLCVSLSLWQWTTVWVGNWKPKSHTEQSVSIGLTFCAENEKQLKLAYAGLLVHTSLLGWFYGGFGHFSAIWGKETSWLRQANQINNRSIIKFFI